MFPQDVSKWDEDAEGFRWDDSDMISVANVTRTMNNPDLHAAALYMCSALEIFVILQGLGGEEGVDALCPEDLRCCLRGHESLPRVWFDLHRVLFSISPLLQKQCPMPIRCNKALKTVQSIARDHAVIYLDSAFHILNKPLWDDLWPVAEGHGMCLSCRQFHQVRLLKMKQEFRDTLVERFTSVKSATAGLSTNSSPWPKSREIGDLRSIWFKLGDVVIVANKRPHVATQIILNRCGNCQKVRQKDLVGPRESAAAMTMSNPSHKHRDVKKPTSSVGAPRSLNGVCNVHVVDSSPRREAASYCELGDDERSEDDGASGEDESMAMASPPWQSAKLATIAVDEDRKHACSPGAGFSSRKLHVSSFASHGRLAWSWMCTPRSHIISYGGGFLDKTDLELENGDGPPGRAGCVLTEREYSSQAIQLNAYVPAMAAVTFLDFVHDSSLNTLALVVRVRRVVISAVQVARLDKRHDGMGKVVVVEEEPPKKRVKAKGRLAYKVHSDILGRRSTVLHKLLEQAISSSAGQEKMDGCPVVRVTDDEDDFGIFLELIYDGFDTFSGDNLPPWTVVKVMVLLGDKYDIPAFSTEGIRRLGLMFPRELSVWEEGLGFSFSEGETITSVANVTRTLEMPHIHVAALYLCCSEPISVLLSGIDGEDGIDGLSMEDLRRCLHGREGLPSAWFQLHAKVFSVSPSVGRQCATTVRCLKALEATRCAATEHAIKHIEPELAYDPLGAASWEKLWPEVEKKGMCLLCRQFYRARLSDVRQEFLDTLVERFALPVEDCAEETVGKES
ncbi:hypothetical protein NM688_g3530 [Phlebia brevispora]|uniref:Uncharacterized protein n=1 Tax=Phlebia brevispora TaxID=194682 RepID=A0ACC1T5F2_9APHY|nr:hypothetical protein NM688_g3530 [Phlebia brevispora]